MLVLSIFINFNFFYNSNYLQLSPNVSQDTPDILYWWNTKTQNGTLMIWTGKLTHL